MRRNKFWDRLRAMASSKNARIARASAPLLFLSMAVLGSVSGLADPEAGSSAGPTDAIQLADHERLITILQTNDIHGAIEPYVRKDQVRVGGMALFSGIVQAIRAGLDQKFGEKAGVLLLDGGDQFQGTLLSNYSEGVVTFKAMNEAGYDAAVPGNHDYDFGPIGWLVDQVTPHHPDQNPRGALLRLKSLAGFPLLSANTYYTESLIDPLGNPVPVSASGCTPRDPAKSEIVWSSARRPEFLKPYVIKEVAGVRVAIVGIDNESTPTTTTAANVSDLCFRDEVEAYLEIRRELEGKADVFVLAVHDGNTSTEFNVTRLVQALTRASFPGRAVDAVVAGHTHWVNALRVNGVPIIQSGANGTMFGRIDLVYDPGARSLVSGKTRYFGGVNMLPNGCPEKNVSFCAPDPAGGTPFYEGVQVASNPRIGALIAGARADIAPLSERKLGVAQKTASSHRYNESPLADALTDVLREVSGAQVAFMNTGGIRAPIDAGEVTYEDFFRVLPFNNRGVVLGPMPLPQLISLLERSIRSCGSYGSLMQSGLRVRFERRDCDQVADGVDPSARLLRVETVKGEVLLDLAGGIAPDPGKTVTVATLDFLATGGSGYDGFKGTPLIRDLGIVREVMADHFTAVKPLAITGEVDGRWQAAAP